jgi:hypothetical protein
LSNEREQTTLEKLDRVFSAMDWEELYPDGFLSDMSTGPLDHCPLGAEPCTRSPLRLEVPVLVLLAKGGWLTKCGLGSMDVTARRA